MSKFHVSRDETYREYTRRIERIIGYIRENLDADLTPASLARVACFSPFHFQRIVRALTGRTLGEHVRSARLGRAATELRDTSTPIMRIALRAGYETQESFTRAFARRFGTTPAAFRKTGGPEHWRDDPAVVHFSRGCILSQMDQPEEKQAMMEVSIKDVPRMKVAFVTPEGPPPQSPEELGEQGGRAIVRLLSQLFLPSDDRYFKCVHVYRSDPRSLDDNDWLDYGFVLDDDVEIKDTSVRTGWIGGGEHAVAMYDGALTGRDEALDWLYGQWLPARSLEPADRPAFEELLGVAGFDFTNLEEVSKLDEVFERDEEELVHELPQVCRFAIHIPVERTRIDAGHQPASRVDRAMREECS